MELTQPAPDLAHLFGRIIGDLCRAVAAGIAADRTKGLLITLIWGRLSRMAQRFARLAARVQDGPLPPPRRRMARVGPEPKPPRKPDPLPRSFGWLLRAIPGTRAYFGQVQHLLSDPKMQGLLEAAPQAGRILRPLCRMLAIPLPPALRPGPGRTKAAAPEPPAEAAAPESPPITPPGSAPGGGQRYVWIRWRGIRMPEPVRPLLRE